MKVEQSMTIFIQTQNQIIGNHWNVHVRTE